MNRYGVQASIGETWELIQEFTTKEAAEEYAAKENKKVNDNIDEDNYHYFEVIEL